MISQATHGKLTRHRPQKSFENHCSDTKCNTPTGYYGL